MSEYRTCINPECPNPNPQPLANFPISTPPASRRNTCADCYRAHKRERQRKVRATQPANVIAIPATRQSRGCPGCPDERRCTSERLWLNGPLPCEGLLADEVGYEYEQDSLGSLWVMPLTAKLNVEMVE